MRVLVLTDSFPALSQKFIINQMASLVRANEAIASEGGEKISLTIASAVPPANGNGFHRLYFEAGLDALTVQLGIPRKMSRRVLKAAAVSLALIFTHPVLLLRSLNFKRYGTMAKNLKTVFYLRFLLAERKKGRRYDLVHCHFGQNGLIGAWMRDAGFASSFIVTFHGADILSFPRRAGQAVYARVYKMAAAVTCSTQFIKKRLIENGCPEDKIAILPMGIFPDEYCSQANLAEERAKDEARPFTALSVGRVLPIKGFEFGIRAAAACRIRYIIAGEGSQRDELQSLINSLGAGELITLVGPKVDAELKALYAAADVFIAPSTRGADGWEEAQGLVIQEAQGAGVPVIASDVGGVSEGLLDGETGFLVPERDADAIAAKLVLLKENPDLRRKMGAKAREFAVTRYDLNRLSLALMGVYETSLQTTVNS